MNQHINRFYATARTQSISSGAIGEANEQLDPHRVRDLTFIGVQHGRRVSEVRGISITKMKSLLNGVSMFRHMIPAMLIGASLLWVIGSN